jgi:hypothetical protein
LAAEGGTTLGEAFDAVLGTVFGAGLAAGLAAGLLAVLVVAGFVAGLTVALVIALAAVLGAALDATGGAALCLAADLGSAAAGLACAPVFAVLADFAWTLLAAAAWADGLLTGTSCAPKNLR